MEGGGHRNNQNSSAEYYGINSTAAPGLVNERPKPTVHPRGYQQDGQPEYLQHARTSQPNSLTSLDHKQRNNPSRESGRDRM